MLVSWARGGQLGRRGQGYQVCPLRSPRFGQHLGECWNARFRV